MKKTISILCLLLLLSAFLFGCGQGNADPQAEELCFPGLNWNMTPAQAIKALRLSKNDYIDSAEEGEYTIGVSHYKAFGVDAQLVIDFADFDGDGTSHLRRVTVSFAPDADMEAIEAKLTKKYGESRPVYKVGCNWSTKTLCKDFLSQAQIDLLSGIITLDDIPDSPVSQIGLRTDANHFAYYEGERTNNAVYFYSEYSFITLENAYPAA